MNMNAFIDTITELTHFIATKSPPKMLKQEQTVCKFAYPIRM